MITLSDLWKYELLHKIFFFVRVEIRYEKGLNVSQLQGAECESSAEVMRTSLRLGNAKR